MYGIRNQVFYQENEKETRIFLHHDTLADFENVKFNLNFNVWCLLTDHSLAAIKRI
jgi:hypothetical protein